MMINTTPIVLDVCCGSRMFWFDKSDKRGIFVDIRNESHVLIDKSSANGERFLTITPDYIADFANLPFAGESFYMVVFDPPHFLRNGAKSWCGLKYGTLKNGWEEKIKLGFAECFRVLKPNGTLIFKWSDTEIPVSKILKLTEMKPLFGHKSGKQQRTHWIAFIK